MKNQEHTATNNEHETPPKAVPELDNERQEALRNKREKAAELAPRDSLEDARHEALEKATSVEHGKEKPATREKSPAERRRGPVSAEAREISYNAKMHEIQSHMTPAGRAFSKIIHNKAVDAVSEAVGSTIARPNAILSGAIAAFLFSLATLMIAKHYGYRLSGFEAIGAFVAGWLIGILYDFFKVMITGKK